MVISTEPGLRMGDVHYLWEDVHVIAEDGHEQLTLETPELREIPFLTPGAGCRGPFADRRAGGARAGLSQSCSWSVAPSLPKPFRIVPMPEIVSACHIAARLLVTTGLPSFASTSATWAAAGSAVQLISTPSASGRSSPIMKSRISAGGTDAILRSSSTLSPGPR